ncbi:MAG: hypothetical protein COU07_02870 [Candidatus Harrisonbacteria bacterium CG10_big_fil_rev_8_21_14_0_10_40_38]|uniref:Uncharacterized protein n=1 Tax=Candidatus Harrisonbacteria bacterium CG10_big_fil_rev_8_21_14_0_10_40_38 TaxID=1974583 RepID=A0A2H0URV4_9BACT|nr:MAG: hypothetical protein COU07_02870 [Candidatus Harrisonbacteria bacterium CG10_big_fil_rev_8_21_14_0_10_40_38]
MENKQKKLCRSRDKKIIFGVAGGVAEYFDIDPVLIRAAFVLLAILDGVGVLLYLILAIIMPSEKLTETTGEHDAKGHASEFASDIKEALNPKIERRNTIGLVFVIIGILLLFRDAFDLHWFKFDVIFPSLVIIFGIWLIFKKNK